MKKSRLNVQDCEFNVKSIQSLQQWHSFQLCWVDRPSVLHGLLLAVVIRARQTMQSMLYTTILVELGRLGSVCYTPLGSYVGVNYKGKFTGND